MLTPDGQPAESIEKLMLLSMWAHSLKESSGATKTKKMIVAGLGKPTYPVHAHTIESYLSYWETLKRLSLQWHANPEATPENAAIDYGDPRGERSATLLMAEAMSAWYDTDIHAENILFTVGGISALKIIFETLNTKYQEIPKYRVITPVPYYSVYATNPRHRLHPIEVMKSPGYKLTAAALAASIKSAYELAEIDHGTPKAILICNPSNPLGNLIDEAELKKIIMCLRQYPELLIIFDEAYAEMCYQEMPSFLKLAPDLKERTIIMRSATKALSAAGERMAVLLVFNPTLMTELLHQNIAYLVHAPRSAQIAYAHTMANFTIDERKKLAKFYQKKVEYVLQRLKGMGASMPDPLYKVEATFYALGNFRELFGLQLPPEAKCALQKEELVSTDEALVYYLLFKERMMLAPLSYFGLSQTSGLLRITCSAPMEELQALMNRLEQCLFDVRKKSLPR